MARARSTDTRLATRDSRQLSRALQAWFAQHARDLPWRRKPTPYRVWVSEIMLQQTQVATVIPYFERFVARFPDMRTLADASENDVLAIWSGLGYYRRARMLHQAAREIVAKHGGELPGDRETLLALPGIGRYSAGAILSIAFNEPQPIVDGNVARVFARLTRERRPIKSPAALRAAWAWAEALVKSPGVEPRLLNQSLMELGATVCTPVSPNCNACPVAALCRARKHGEQTRLPRTAAKPAFKRVRYVATLARDKRGRVLLVRRAPGEESLLPDGLWELPHRSCGLRPLKFAAASSPLHMVRQTIMNWKVELVVVDSSGEPDDRCAGERKWFSKSELAALPMASITKKALAVVQFRR